jgi:hypothetical protein
MHICECCFCYGPMVLPYAGLSVLSFSAAMPYDAVMDPAMNGTDCSGPPTGRNAEGRCLCRNDGNGAWWILFAFAFPSLVCLIVGIIGGCRRARVKHHTTVRCEVAAREFWKPVVLLPMWEKLLFPCLRNCVQCVDARCFGGTLAAKASDDSDDEKPKPPPAAANPDGTLAEKVKYLEDALILFGPNQEAIVQQACRMLKVPTVDGRAKVPLPQLVDSCVAKARAGAHPMLMDRDPPAPTIVMGSAVVQSVERVADPVAAQHVV